MNGRKAKQKRRALRERNEQLLAAVRAAVPVRDVDGPQYEGYEVWRRGPAVMMLPVVPLDYPEPVQTALTVHRMAILTHDCPRCDNEVTVTEAGSVMLRHTADCPADPDRLVALAAEHGIAMGRHI